MRLTLASTDHGIPGGRYTPKRASTNRFLNNDVFCGTIIVVSGFSVFIHQQLCMQTAVASTPLGSPFAGGSQVQIPLRRAGSAQQHVAGGSDPRHACRRVSRSPTKPERLGPVPDDLRPSYRRAKKMSPVFLQCWYDSEESSVPDEGPFGDNGVTWDPCDLCTQRPVQHL